MPKDYHELLTKLALLRWKVESALEKENQQDQQNHQPDLRDIYQDLLSIIKETQEVFHS